MKHAPLAALLHLNFFLIKVDVLFKLVLNLFSILFSIQAKNGMRCSKAKDGLEDTFINIVEVIKYYK